MRVLASLVAVALAMVLTSCNRSEDTRPQPLVSEPGDSGPPSVPPQPKAHPIEDPDPSDDVPDGLVDQPSVEQTDALSRAGQSRLDAENFAISFAQLLMDTREGRDQSALIEGFSHDQLPQPIRDHLLIEYRDLRDLRLGRHFDPEFPALVRSTFEGSEDAPARVNVEVAAAIPLSGPENSVAQVRVDVGRDQDRWKVLDFGGPAMGAFVERPEEVRSVLEGSGWRRLPD